MKFFDILGIFSVLCCAAIVALDNGHWPRQLESALLAILSLLAAIFLPLLAGSWSLRSGARHLENLEQIYEPLYKIIAGPEFAMHAIFGPQHIGEYPKYAPTCCDPNLTHLTNPGLCAIL